MSADSTPDIKREFEEAYFKHCGFELSDYPEVSKDIIWAAGWAIERVKQEIKASDHYPQICVNMINVLANQLSGG